MVLNLNSSIGDANTLRYPSCTGLLVGAALRWAGRSSAGASVLFALIGKNRNFLCIVWAVLLLNLLFASFPAKAEYGDVVMNRQSDIQGVRPVIFSHTFHRIRFRCKACHTELGFKMRAGGNDVTMFAITDGKYCGACHNGNIAWGPENCNLCHSGKKGLKNGVVGSHQTTGPGIW